MFETPLQAMSCVSWASGRSSSYLLFHKYLPGLVEGGGVGVRLTSGWALVLATLGAEMAIFWTVVKGETESAPFSGVTRLESRRLSHLSSCDTGSATRDLRNDWEMESVSVEKYLDSSSINTQWRFADGCHGSRLSAKLGLGGACQTACRAVASTEPSLLEARLFIGVKAEA